MGKRVKAICISATGSGAGKTTVTLAVLAALKRRGLETQPYKAGPDFIDPGHHHQVVGRRSHNLDTWILSAKENKSIFSRYAHDADIAVIEGVMGVFDGFGPDKETGSTAHLAKLLSVPALLVISAKGMARSIAAMVGGYQSFDPDLQWAGAIANQCGSSRHITYLGQAMDRHDLMPFTGGLLRDPELTMPERHLGLITAEEKSLGLKTLERLADLAEEGLDLDRLLDSLPHVQLEPPAPKDLAPTRDVRIGVARDEAFCFYYEENLRRLAVAGAELVFFSPLRDTKIPTGLHGLYLGGGYPELFAHRLSENTSLLGDISHLCKQGLPVLAECGGLIYLSRSVTDSQGMTWPLCGVLPLDVAMNQKLRRLGYCEVAFSRDTPLGPQGTLARGHEFHYSHIKADHGGADFGLFELTNRGSLPLGPAGWRVGNTLASYVHFHFGSNGQLADSFVEFCRRAG